MRYGAKGGPNGQTRAFHVSLSALESRRFWVRSRLGCGLYALYVNEGTAILIAHDQPSVEFVRGATIV